MLFFIFKSFLFTYILFHDTISSVIGIAGFNGVAGPGAIAESVDDTFS